MPRVVVKVGGSNLKYKKDIHRVIEVIKSYDQPLIVVISAFYGVTDYLISSLEEAPLNEGMAKKVARCLYDQKKEILQELVADKSDRESILNSISEVLLDLEKYLHGVALTGDASRALEDNILSFGERLSATLLQGVLAGEGLQAEVALPENIGLYTNGEFGNGTIDFARSTSPVRDALAKKQIFIVPGFYGISESGKVTLLGRGGTDYAAASIARCVGASSLDIWKDVDGFQSADPKLIDNPVRIDRLTYTEASELAYFGAKILHPRTVEPLSAPHIPIRIFNIRGKLNAASPLSVINSESYVREGIIKSVAYSDEFGILKLMGPGVGLKPGILAKVATALCNENININSVITSQISINMLLAKKDLRTAYEVVSSVDLATVGEVVMNESVSVVAAIGDGLIDNYGVAARIFSSMAERGINVIMSCSGASSVVSYFLVDEADRTEAIRAVHDEFFGLARG